MYFAITASTEYTKLKRAFYRTVLIFNLKNDENITAHKKVYVFKIKVSWLLFLIYIVDIYFHIKTEKNKDLEFNVL